MPLARSITLRSSSAVLRFLQFVLHARHGVESRDADIEDGLHTLLLQPAYDIGRNARVDGGSDGGAVALVDEHGDRALHHPAHLEELLQRVTARTFQAYDDHIGIDIVDRLQEPLRLTDVDTLRMPSLAQSRYQDLCARRVLLDNGNVK